MRLYRPSPRVVRALDAALVLAILVVGAWWGARFERAWRAAGQTSQYYQSYFEPAVMTACGRGFAVSTSRPPALDAFLSQQVDTFDCASLPADLALRTEGLYQQTWYYLMHTVAAAWWLLGISWSGLTPLFGLLFGTVLAISYGLFRLGMGRPLALICTAAFAVSTSHLVNLPHLRDYAKAPFVLALLLLMAWIVRGEPGRRRVLGLSCLAGAVLGIGYGFRTDLLASIPPLLISIVLFLRGGVFKNLLLKAQAVAVCLLVFVTVAWPVVSYVTGKGGCQWHVTLLGFSYYFDEPLGIEPASYDWGPYSDDFLYTTVGSRFNPRADSAAGPAFCGPEYDRETGVYLGRILTTFTGDVATRAVAALAAITDFEARTPEAPLPSYDGPFYLWRGDVINAIAGYGPLLVLPLLLLVAAADLRLGLWALCVLLWFGGLPMLQFHPRHFFHLEVIGWFIVGTLASLAGRGGVKAAVSLWRRGRARLSGQPVKVPTADATPVSATPPLVVAKRVLVLAVCCALVGAAVSIARRVQQARVTSLVASMTRATSEPIALTQTEEGGLLAFAPALPDPPGVRGKFWVEYLRIEVDPAACGPEGAVVVRYDPPQQDLTRVWKVARDQASILTPVFRSFRDITVPAAAQGCVRGVYRASSLKPFPAWLFIEVPADLHRLRAVQGYDGPDRMNEAADLGRFALHSPRGFARRVTDLSLNLVWPPWGRPNVITRPDGLLVTRPEMRRVRAQVADAQIAYRSKSARAAGEHWEIDGQAEGPFAYLLASTRQEVERGSRLLVTGRLESGGLSVGLLKDGRWLDQTGVKRLGVFAVVIEPPAEGPYDIIVANNEADTTKSTRATITSIAWIEPTSAAPRRTDQ